MISENHFAILIGTIYYGILFRSNTKDKEIDSTMCLITWMVKPFMPQEQLNFVCF